MRFILAACFGLFFLFLPFSVNAQGIVPIACTGADAPISCGTCEFVDLVSNVIQFVITLSTILATLVIIWAGFKLVTSAGNPSAMTYSKKVITNVLIGYVLLLCAVIIVNTILGVLIGDDNRSLILSWQKVDCVYANAPVLREVSEPNIEGFDAFVESNPGWQRGVYGFNDIPATRCSSVDNCAAAITTCEASGMLARYDNQIPGLVECDLPNNDSGSYLGPLAQCSADNPFCSVTVLRNAGFTESQANVMSCIAITESSGNPSIGPYNERHVGSDSSACGLFQVTQTTWNTYKPSGECSDWRSNCQRAACNAQVALTLVRNNNYKDWSCDGCNAKAQACVNKYQ